MKKLFISIMACLMLVLSPVAAFAYTAHIGFTSIYDLKNINEARKISNKTVLVSSYDNLDKTWVSKTGWIAKGGYIVTTYTAIENASKLKIRYDVIGKSKTQDTLNITDISIVAVDEVNDIAVLKPNKLTKDQDKLIKSLGYFRLESLDTDIYESDVALAMTYDPSDEDSPLYFLPGNITSYNEIVEWLSGDFTINYTFYMDTTVTDIGAPITLNGNIISMIVSNSFYNDDEVYGLHPDNLHAILDPIIN